MNNHLDITWTFAVYRPILSEFHILGQNIPLGPDDCEPAVALQWISLTSNSRGVSDCCCWRASGQWWGASAREVEASAFLKDMDLFWWPTLAGSLSFGRTFLTSHRGLGHLQSVFLLFFTQGQVCMGVNAASKLSQFPPHYLSHNKMLAPFITFCSWLLGGPGLMQNFASGARGQEGLMASITLATTDGIGFWFLSLEADGPNLSSKARGSGGWQY